MVVESCPASLEAEQGLIRALPEIPWYVPGKVKAAESPQSQETVVVLSAASITATCGTALIQRCSKFSALPLRRVWEVFFSNPNTRPHPHLPDQRLPILHFRESKKTRTEALPCLATTEVFSQNNEAKHLKLSPVDRRYLAASEFSLPLSINGL